MTLDELKGREISAIAFVRDYVELRFVDDEIVRYFVLPTVEVQGVLFAPNEPGWRDALCGLIGATVDNIVLESEQELTLVAQGHTVRAFLRPDDGSDEAVQFVPMVGGPSEIY